MSIAIFFWVIFIIWTIFGLWRSGPDRYAIGYHGVVAVLIFLLGWRVFGFPIHG